MHGQHNVKKKKILCATSPFKNNLKHVDRGENGHEGRFYCENILTLDYFYRGNNYIVTVLVRTYRRVILKIQ